jgi:Ca-activated chloride channel family protein
MKKIIFTIAVLVLHQVARPQGFMIPIDERIPLPNLISQKVVIDIKDQLAKVQVEQEFLNSTQAPIEGVYCFPIPKAAVVSGFSMVVDGKVLEGELLDREDAVRLYDEIVRKNIDPALLEMIDHKFFRLKVFPIQPGEQRKINLTYNQVLENNDGLIKVVHPLRGNFQFSRANPVVFRNPRPQKGAPPQRENSEEIAVKISARGGLKNIYSPTHKIDIVRQSDTDARVHYQGRGDAAGDFILYYGLNEGDLGLNLLTHRDGDDDGYFMMLISPNVKIPNYKILNKDLILVLDISGSMAGDKLLQAKEALKFAINNLSSNDYFNIIAFSTEAKLFKSELVNAAQARQEALEFINRLEAKGGTNINEALLTALDMKGGRSHSPKIVFITDGLPTVGVKDVDEIRSNVKRLNKERYRIFTFGVGYDVNTQLLDGIAQDSRAVADYIEPDDDIETAISSFYSKISEPVLSTLALDYGAVEVSNVYPKALPDLFRGSQLTIVGRYKNSGSAQIKLAGQFNDSKKSFTYDVNFPEQNPDNPQLPQLWATRKIGFLLEQIKLNPNERERQDLVAEVVQLSKRYGIVTPYTAIFIHEDEPILSDSRDRVILDYQPAAFNAEVGKSAVSYSKTSRRLKEAETIDGRLLSGLKRAGDRTFVQDARGYWLDVEFDEKADVLHIKYGSEAYFTLLKIYPKTAPYLALGTKVIFKFNNKFVQVDEKGVDQITAAGIKKFFANK